MMILNKHLQQALKNWHALCSLANFEQMAQLQTLGLGAEGLTLSGLARSPCESVLLL